MCKNRKSKKGRAMIRGLLSSLLKESRELPNNDERRVKELFDFDLRKALATNDAEVLLGWLKKLFGAYCDGLIDQHDVLHYAKLVLTYAANKDEETWKASDIDSVGDGSKTSYLSHEIYSVIVGYLGRYARLDTLVSMLVREMPEPHAPLPEALLNGAFAGPVIFVQDSAPQTEELDDSSFLELLFYLDRSFGREIRFYEFEFAGFLTSHICEKRAFVVAPCQLLEAIALSLEVIDTDWEASDGGASIVDSGATHASTPVEKADDDYADPCGCGGRSCGY